MKRLMEQRGFTLLELMSAVAVIGTLSAIAMPVYQNYVAKSQVAEGFVLMGPAKNAVAEYCQNNGVHARDNLEAALPDPTMITGKFVDQVTIANGMIYSRFGQDAHPELRGQTVSLVPEDCGNKGWSCTTTISNNLLRQCKNDNTWKEGLHPSITFPAGSESLALGETYDFTWDGGGGPDALVVLRRYNPEDHSWTDVVMQDAANTGVFSLELQEDLQPGTYMLNVRTFDQSYGCALAAITGDYYSHENRTLAYSKTKDRTYQSHDQGEALDGCNNSTYPGHVATTDCEIVDVNGSGCTSSAGGQSNSQLFSIGM